MLDLEIDQSPGTEQAKFDPVQMQYANQINNLR